MNADYFRQCLRIILHNPEYITVARTNDLAEEQPYELCRVAVLMDGLALQYIDDPSTLTIIDAVCENPLALQFVPSKQQTNVLVKIALNYNWRALQFVSRQTYQLCAHAIRQNWRAVRLVRMKNSIHSNHLIHKDYYKLFMLAIQINPRAIRYIQKLSKEDIIAHAKKINNDDNCDMTICAEEMMAYHEYELHMCQMTALRKNTNVFKYIQSPTDEMCTMAILHNPHLSNYIHPNLDVNEE